MTRTELPRSTLLLALSAALLLVGGCGIFGKNRKPPATMGQRIAVLDFETQIEAEPELGDIAVEVPAASVNADWTQPGGSAAGLGGNLALSQTPRRQWSVSIGAGTSNRRALNAPPAIAENRLFVIDTLGRVSAFNASSGASLWRETISVKGESDAAAFGGGVSVAAGRVVATTGYGTVTAFDAGSGQKLWQVQRPTPLRGAPTLAAGRVFVTSEDDQMAALASDDGAEIWDANATIEPSAVMGVGTPSVALDTVVAGFQSGELFALRVENGRTSWQDQLTRSGRTTALGALAGIVASPVIDDGRVYAISHAGRMVAIDMASGQRVWEQDFAGVNRPWPAGDWIYTVGIDSQLVAFRRSDGKIRWATQLQQWKNAKKKKGAVYWYGPVLAGGQLILLSSRGEMVFVRPQDGKVSRTEKLASSAHLPPVVANNMLYVLTDDGKLSAYR